MLVSASFTEQRSACHKTMFTFHSQVLLGFLTGKETGCDVHWFPVFHCSLQFSVILSVL